MTDNSNNIFNDAADFWINFGPNPLPADTINKRPSVPWKEYQDKPIPIDLHEYRKRNGEYNNGISVMTGKIHKGKYAGKYLIGIDCDSKKALEEILTRDGKTITLQELANLTRVEQHKDNPDKAHIYILSTKPFKNKGRDPRVPELAIEIKCEHFTMVTAPSIHRNGYPYEILGLKEPVLCDDFEIHLNNIFKKYNIEYFEQSNSNNSNNSSNKLPDELRKLAYTLEIPKDFKFRINEGSRHDTLLLFANTLLFVNRFDINISRKEELKTFFFEANNKLCIPEPLPNNEIETIWKDALKRSEEKSSKVNILNNDEKDIHNFNSKIIIQLEKGPKLIEKEFVQNLVYDIQADSVDCSLNTKYKHNPRIVVPINIKQWPDVRKDFRKQCEEKRIEEQDIVLLLEALDRNYDLIKKHYLENHRKNNAALVAVQKRIQRQQLIENGTEFLMANDTYKTIEETNDIIFYNKNKGVYEYGGEVIIGKELEKKYGFQLTTGIVNEIRDHIIRKTGVTKDKFDSDLDIINVENELLNIKTGERLPHTPDYLSLNQIPIRYDPEAKALKFEKFLSEVLHPEQIQTAKEIIAYTFIRKNIFQYWFVLIGNGGNGKNVFIGIVQGLHGRQNHSSVPLTHLGNPNHRFALSQLENKNINVDTELSPKSYNDLSTLKKLTDPQPITVERKGKDLFDVELWAKQFLCCNKLPQSSDDSDARFRREILLAFPYQFVEEKDEEQNDDPNIRIADPFLLDKIINDKDEMSGILNIVIESLKSIYENKKIYSNSTINQRRVRAELIADPVKAFYNENCKVPSDPAEFETKDNLYNKFKDFCIRKNSYITKKKNFFYQLSREHDANEGRAEITDPDTNKKHTPRVIFNIHLLTDAEKKIRDEQDAAE